MWGVDVDEGGRFGRVLFELGWLRSTTEEKCERQPGILDKVREVIGGLFWPGFDVWKLGVLTTGLG